MGNCYSNWATRLEGLWKQGATDDDDRDNGQLLATATVRDNGQLLATGQHDWKQGATVRDNGQLLTRLEGLWKQGATDRDNWQLLATGQHDLGVSGNREQQLETMGNC